MATRPKLVCVYVSLQKVQQFASLSAIVNGSAMRFSETFTESGRARTVGLTNSSDCQPPIRPASLADRTGHRKRHTSANCEQDGQLPTSRTSQTVVCLTYAMLTIPSTVFSLLRQLPFPPPFCTCSQKAKQANGAQNRTGSHLGQNYNGARRRMQNCERKQSAAVSFLTLASSCVKVASGHWHAAVAFATCYVSPRVRICSPTHTHKK